MFCGGPRVSQYLWDYHHLPPGLGLGLRLGVCGTRIVQLSSFVLKPLPSIANRDFTHRLHHWVVSSSSPKCKSPDEIPVLHGCFSQQEDDRDLPVEVLPLVAGGVVALGKFEALHIGHRELAIQASRIGTPYLLSFVGMAEVLGWEPRAPIVAKCDRKRVLSSWELYCGGVAPVEFELEFSSVRHLSPRQFVEKLSKELRVSGVVAGENYRFGYRASGDASDLVRLCEDYGIGAYVINSVMDKNQDSDTRDVKDRGQVSSTRVRKALARGDMRYVTELVGRPHRLVLRARSQDILSGENTEKRRRRRRRISVPKSCMLNLPPGDGCYEECSLVVGDENLISCRVEIDASDIHIELDGRHLCNSDWDQEFQLLGIEFG